MCMIHFIGRKHIPARNHELSMVDSHKNRIHGLMLVITQLDVPCRWMFCSCSQVSGSEYTQRVYSLPRPPNRSALGSSAPCRGVAPGPICQCEVIP